MEEKHVRSLGVLVALLWFFPTWLVLMALYHFGLREAERIWEIEIALWIKNLGSFALLAVSIVFVTKRVSRWMEKRYPHSKARSADWRDAG